MNGFRTLNDFVSPAPLPALTAIFITAGAYGLAIRCAKNESRQGPAFIIVLALTGALVHGLALLQQSGLNILRALAGGLALIGILSIPVLIRSARSVLRRFGGGTLWDQIVTAIAAIAVASLGLASLGPVTDPDSLDYHLGVPVDWLRHGGVHIQPHWLHARLTGLGEALNMMGLAAGTDCLGAVLQVAGLIAIIVAVTANGATVRDRLFALLLVLPPAILPLTTAQKPQLLPAAALVLAFLFTTAASSLLDFALLFGCIAFAVSCKYSFAVPGAVVIAAALFAAWRHGRLRIAIVCAVAAMALLALPVGLRNLALFGDPLSPFFETLRAHPEPELMRFAEYLAAVGGAHDLPGIARFLFHLIVPSGAGDAQTILGIGLFASVLAFGVAGSGPALAGLACVLLFTVWRGQMAPRYLLESWLWCVPAVVAAPWGRLKRWLYPALALQTAGVAAMAIYAAGTLFPGALTPSLRQNVMLRSTYGYAESLWADQNLPADTVMMSAGRAYALMPRPFQIPECASCGGASLFQLLRSEDFFEGASLTFVAESALRHRLPAGCAARVIAEPQRFKIATRNPFNHGVYEVLAEEVHCE